jgi:hypothetical protein
VKLKKSVSNLVNKEIKNILESVESMSKFSRVGDILIREGNYTTGNTK